MAQVSSSSSSSSSSKKTESTTASSSDNDYVQYGNIFNAVVLSLSLLYTTCVVIYTQKGRTGVLDDEWKVEGFCIQNRDVLYWSSHETSTYVDFVFCALLGYLYYNWHTTKGMEFANQFIPMGIVGTLGHGVAHWMLAIKMRQKDTMNNDDEIVATEQQTTSNFETILFCTFFWFPLLKASIPKSSVFHAYTLAIVVTYVQRNYLAEVYGFTYIQTILSVATHVSQLLLSENEKNCRSYMTLPLIAALPAVIISILEATSCNRFFKSWGGHVWCDACIIIGMTMYYIDAYFHCTGSTVDVDDDMKKKKE